MPAYEFGPMRLEADQHALFCHGEPVPLAPRLFDILLVLVESQGKLVSQEALRNRVWPDSFVQDAAVVKNVSILRGALRGCLPDVEVIGTLPKRGYQFLLPVLVLSDLPVIQNVPVLVDEVAQTSQREISQQDSPVPWASTKVSDASPGTFRWITGALAAAILTIAAVLIATHKRPQPWFLASALSPANLTPGSDVEAMPAISPDGQNLA